MPESEDERLAGIAQLAGNLAAFDAPAVGQVHEADIELDDPAQQAAQTIAAQDTACPAVRRFHRLGLSRVGGRLRARNCACRPLSTICPRSSTQIRSAPMTVDSRCAMTIVVRPRIRLRSAAWTCRSDSLSSAEVASSSST